MASTASCPETIHEQSVLVKEADKWSVAPEVITVTARQDSPWKAPVSSTARRVGGQL